MTTPFKLQQFATFFFVE